MKPKQASCDIASADRIRKMEAEYALLQAQELFVVEAS
jgi:hypothetical protein